MMEFRDNGFEFRVPSSEFGILAGSHEYFEIDEAKLDGKLETRNSELGTRNPKLFKEQL